MWLGWQARALLEQGEMTAGQEVILPQHHRSYCRAAQVTNLLHTLKVGQLDNYAFKCPPGLDPNNTTIPGVYLPRLMNSSQSLFGD